ncbi:adenosylcobinamide-phosphate synthase [Rubrimonas cliftonensis]|uniref:Cobalamin biosynthesis protein CobD n=2 Tax=Rubrimonas cliftonensis TaxID=89524 RepID=A0A1H4FXJ0_9RHOB|nr:adenosylcobinamide-phosphate synthase CbiB [Rubrimonas cliftonensis]SEB01550.1 adenosylcobinamide-phosphate synthase [Rubrimonas cliftonensis]
MAALAILIDAALGWPDPLFRRIGHPVTWIGALIARLDRGFNRGGRGRRLFAGGVATAVVVAAAALPMALIEAVLPPGPVGLALAAALCWPWLAVRSLHDHVAAVATPLAAGDLAGARRAVAMIVGRDPERLDAAGVSRAALESLAENASDGVTAPLFWAVVGGLPGVAAYKAINTLDSMIGHRTPDHEAFGKAAARLDDLVNLIPARLTGLALALVSARPRTAVATMLRDAPRHRSPNAGWPEAAMAAGLGVRVSGPRVYGDRVADEPWVNAGAPDPDALAIRRGLALYRRMMALALLALVIAALA